MLSCAWAEPEPTVLVVDFEVPAGVEWGWARHGLADLAVEVLAERGLVTVDRDLLSVVKFEQTLGTGQSGVQLGRWLGATYLASGSLETNLTGRVRLTGSLTCVETAEQVGACSVEGDCKKELQALLGRWAAGLVERVKLDAGRPGGGSDNPLKPEALMLFHRGVEACAANKPALAVGFFLSARAMDPRLQAAREWEAHAYDLGGLAVYATAVRGKTNGLPLAGISKATKLKEDASSRVINVLTPVWLGVTNGLPAGLPSVSALRLTLENTVLSSPGIRVSRPESFSESVAEQDRQLALGFDARSTSRYARWLVSDATLYCTLSPGKSGRVLIEVGLMDALTARRLTQHTKELPPKEIADACPRIVFDVLKAWGSTGRERTTPGQTIQAKTPALSEEELGSVPDYRQVVMSLDGHMRGSPSLFHHQLLADFYLYVGYAGLAELELEEVLRVVEQVKPDMDASLTSAYWWVNGYPCHSTVERKLGARARHNHFLDNPILDASLRARARERFATVRIRLLNEYPASLGSYAVYYVEASRAAERKDWETSYTGATGALQSLEKREQTGDRGHIAILSLFDTRAFKAAMLMSCQFLKGNAAQHLKRTDEALTLYDRALDLIEKEQLGELATLQYPILCYEKEPLLIGLSGANQSFQLRALIKDERQAILKGHAGGTQGLRDVQMTESNSESSEAAVQQLRAIIRSWDSQPPEGRIMCQGLDQALACVKRIKNVPVEQRKSIVKELSRSYLRMTGIEPDRLADKRSVIMMGPRMTNVTFFYQHSGLNEEFLYWLDVLLAPPVDATFGFAMVRGYVSAFCAWVNVDSMCRKKISIDVNQTSFTNTVLQSNSVVRRIEGFFEQHRNIPRMNELQASFWDQVSCAAAKAEDYELWYVAGRRAHQLNPKQTPTPLADLCSARIALFSGGPDILLSAIQIRESLGPSANPVSSPIWYSAGVLCFINKEYKQALTALQLFRETYNEADIQLPQNRLTATPSEDNIYWNLEYVEGVSLVRVGQVAEGAARLRPIAKQLGARSVYSTYSMLPDKNNFAQLPLGLMASEILQELHMEENQESTIQDDRKR
jgi:tetratricopeptide (TPR) repeat protein